MKDYFDEYFSLKRMLSNARTVSKTDARGIDGVSPKDIGDYISEHYADIISALRNGAYRPQSVAVHYIPKRSGGSRRICVATALDRVFMRCLHDLVSSMFEEDFSSHSYAFRKDISPLDEVSSIMDYCMDNQCRFAVQIDLKDFFDHIDHDRILHLLRQRITDGKILKLINRFMKVEYVDRGYHYKAYEGIQQGSALSPTLSNIALTMLDRELERRGHRFARYADDLIIMANSEEAAHRIDRSVRRFIEKKCKLPVNDGKSHISSIKSGFNLLGFRIYRKGDSVHLIPQHGRAKDIRNRVRETIRHEEPEAIGGVLKEAILGWTGYFGIGEVGTIARDLDCLIDREIHERELREGIAIDRQGVSCTEFCKERHKAGMATQQGGHMLGNRSNLSNTLLSAG